ncbi:MAG: hypothetical protein Q9209_005745 [Squamulea sp. 1 TL-2023]
MPITKESPAAIHEPSDESPPSYSESLNNSQPPNPITHRVRILISTHISPHIEGDSITTLVVVPSNVSPLFAPSAPTSLKDTASFAYPGEMLVGFTSHDNPTLIRLSGTENGLEFWRRPSVLHELQVQLRQELVALGYEIVLEAPSASGVEWKSADKVMLRRGEARANVEMKEVCLRIENTMGLYETRTGKAIVVRVELGRCEEDN